MTFKYSIRLQWSDEDGGYIATIPELPGVSAFGATHEEATREVQDAADGHVAWLREDGIEVPGPLVREAGE